jgi:acid phosphatase family membrane protein YuiD
MNTKKCIAAVALMVALIVVVHAQTTQPKAPSQAAQLDKIIQQNDKILSNQDEIIKAIGELHQDLVVLKRRSS